MLAAEEIFPILKNIYGILLVTQSCEWVQLSLGRMLPSYSPPQMTFVCTICLFCLFYHMQCMTNCGPGSQIPPLPLTLFTF